MTSSGHSADRINGWTGGQYSLARAGFGLALALRFALHAFAAPPLEASLHATGALAAVGFALGWHERASAFVLAPSLIAAGFVGGERGPGQVHWLALGVLLHLATPPAPFLSLDARGRVDPRGGWSMPQHVRVWALLAFLGSLATWWLSRSEPLLATLWFASLCADPAWIAPRAPQGPTWMFYDGSCGLCQRSVRFVLAEEAPPGTLHFAPLHGEQFARCVDEARARALPDSVVLLEPDGTLLVRSQAALALGERMGGAWRILSLVARGVPRPLRDLAYDALARVRKRLFAASKDACPMLPPDLRARFRA